MRAFPVECPWCGECFSVRPDSAGPQEELRELCPHCGFPVDLKVRRDAGGGIESLIVCSGDED